MDHGRTCPARDKGADGQRRERRQVDVDRIGHDFRARGYGHSADAAEGQGVVGRRIDRPGLAACRRLRHMGRADYKRILSGRIGDADSRPRATGAQPNEGPQGLVVDVRPDRKDLACAPAPIQPSAQAGAAAILSTPAAAAATNSLQIDLMTRPPLSPVGQSLRADAIRRSGSSRRDQASPVEDQSHQWSLPLRMATYPKFRGRSPRCGG